MLKAGHDAERGALPLPMYRLNIIEQYHHPPSIFYATLSYLFFRLTRKKTLSMVLAVVALFLILLIGVSRIYLGVHYPSDVLAGYVAGLFWFATVIALERTIVFFKLFKQSEEKPP